MIRRLLILVLSMAGIAGLHAEPSSAPDRASALTASAFHEYQTGAYEAARAQVDEALGLDPDHPRGLLLRGLLHVANGRPSPGLTDLGRAIDLAPDDPFGYIQRGWVTVRMQLNEAAVSDFDAALRLQPGNSSATIGRALARLQKQDVEGAIADAEQALAAKTEFTLEDASQAVARLQDADLLTVIRESWAHDDWNDARPSAYAIRGSARAAQGHLAEALADFDNAVRLQPRDPIFLMERGRLRSLNHLYRDALEDYRQACALVPGFAACHLLAAELARVVGETTLAREHATSALLLQPDDVNTQVAAGLVLLAVGDPGEAEKVLVQATAAATAPPAALAGLVQLRIAQGQLDHADTLLLRAEKAGLATDVVALYRGRRLVASGDLDGAMQAFKEALAANPRQIEARRERKRIRAGRRDHMGADLELARALEQEPDSVELLIERAWFQLEFVDDRIAHELAGRARTLQPGHPLVLFFDTFRALEQQDWSGAISRCSQVLASGLLDPATVRSVRATAYFESGDAASASRDLDWIESHRPGDEFIINLQACRHIAEGNLERATGLLSSALAATPEADDVRMNLALCQWRAGDPIQAARTLDGLRITDEPFTQAWRQELWGPAGSPGNADPLTSIDQKLAVSKSEGMARVMERFVTANRPTPDARVNLYVPGRRYRAGDFPHDWLLLLMAKRSALEKDDAKLKRTLEYIVQHTSATRVGHQLARHWLAELAAPAGGR